jgi:hypothetical protein
MNFIPEHKTSQEIGGPNGDLRSVLLLIEQWLAQSATDPSLGRDLKLATERRLASGFAETVGSSFPYNDYVSDHWPKIAVANSDLLLVKQLCDDLAMALWSDAGIKTSAAAEHAGPELFRAIANVFAIAARNDSAAALAQRNIHRDLRAIRDDEKASNWMSGIDDE